MSVHNVIVVGGPDTGKTNYIGRLWIALRTGSGVLKTLGMPGEIKFVEDTVNYLHQGRFAPRTNKNVDSDQISLTIPLSQGNSPNGAITELIIPDISGEIWENAVETYELPQQRMVQLESAVGALIFVRVLSSLNVNPLDWVNSAKLMDFQGGDSQENKIPTQVMLCEILRFLELKLTNKQTSRKPRLAVVITAWDLLDICRSTDGPRCYLQKEYPLFAGRLDDMDCFDVSLFATSIFGGNPEADETLHDEFLEKGLISSGYVRFDCDGIVGKSSDFTLPIAWAIGSKTLD